MLKKIGYYSKKNIQERAEEEQRESHEVADIELEHLNFSQKIKKIPYTKPEIKNYKGVKMEEYTEENIDKGIVEIENSFELDNKNNIIWKGPYGFKTLEAGKEVNKRINEAVKIQEQKLNKKHTRKIEELQNQIQILKEEKDNSDKEHLADLKKRDLEGQKKNKEAKLRKEIEKKIREEIEQEEIEEKTPESEILHNPINPKSEEYIKSEICACGSRKNFGAQGCKKHKKNADKYRKQFNISWEEAWIMVWKELGISI
ncbi:hypothetical protein ES703_24867 [subsurface metagenome]